MYQASEADPPAMMDLVPATPLSLGLLQVDVSGRGRVLALCELQLFGGEPDVRRTVKAGMLSLRWSVWFDLNVNG